MIRSQLLVLTALFASMALAIPARAQESDPTVRLKGLDESMNKLVSDWNTPGIAIGIVANDKLIYAKGYGYRDLGKQLPFTPRTLVQVASNSKLFTAIAAGLLVDEGKLTWDRPVRESVPSISFYDDALNNTVTLRDMLAHRTGITRHDLIWYKADFSRKELFDRLKYLEPRESPRQLFLYNNLMYAATGYLIELKTGKTWETFLRERLFKPLKMTSTVFTVADMQKAPDFAVPYTEKRDSTELYKIPYYEETAGMAPAGAIISNIDDMSRWLIALMNEGRLDGKQVIPSAVVKATLEPAIPMANTQGESYGFWERQNAVYGMGRWTASYRGHLIAFHGGDLDGFHSQVSYLPQDGLGVIVFVIGDHTPGLYDTVTYSIYERLLGMTETPWSERWLAIRKKSKEADTLARTKAGGERVAGTAPSHKLEEYVGDYEHPAYGVVHIGLKDRALTFKFHGFDFGLSHFHFERFDTPDDERYGKWSINFVTNFFGEVDRVLTSMDEQELVFTRRPETVDPKLLPSLAGPYETPSGKRFDIRLADDGTLSIVFVGQPVVKLVPYRGLQFRIKEAADTVFEFVLENGKVKAVKQTDPAGEYVLPRRK
jgi:CubicO group peptidase (beta-lactamase class C family)